MFNFKMDNEILLSVLSSHVIREKNTLISQGRINN